MSSASDSSARKDEVLETAFTQSPALERAFYAARGICEKFRQSHPSKRLCQKKKGNLLKLICFVFSWPEVMNSLERIYLLFVIVKNLFTRSH